MGRNSRWRVGNLGKKLRSIRDQLGLTQAEMVNALGLERKLYRNNISAYETGDREPPLPVLLAYAKLAGVSTDFLIDDDAKLTFN
jgi:transcriptional regulator with XRE-family HTH domain